MKFLNHSLLGAFCRPMAFDHAKLQFRQNSGKIKKADYVLINITAFLDS
jgi:hypothetical protein